MIEGLVPRQPGALGGACGNMRLFRICTVSNAARDGAARACGLQVDAVYAPIDAARQRSPGRSAAVYCSVPLSSPARESPATPVGVSGSRSSVCTTTDARPSMIAVIRPATVPAVGSELSQTAS